MSHLRAQIFPTAIASVRPASSGRAPRLFAVDVAGGSEPYGREAGPVAAGPDRTVAGRRDPAELVRTAEQPRAALLLLMVGLPGAGKTTRAKELAAEYRALRLTPDEWMIQLFGESTAGRKRDILEGRLILVALRTLRVGTNVVLDFGLWSRDERSALRWLAASAGARCRVVYLPVDEDVQRVRIAHRQATAPHTTFPMTEADLDSWRGLFQAPDDAELRGADLPEPPAGWPDWPRWAANRWPPLAARDAADLSGVRPPADEQTGPP